MKLDPSVEPCSVTVSLRAPQPPGIFRVTSVTVAAAPRSTWTHCGNALFADSQ